MFWAHMRKLSYTYIIWIWHDIIEYSIAFSHLCAVFPWLKINSDGCRNSEALCKLKRIFDWVFSGAGLYTTNPPDYRLHYAFLQSSVACSQHFPDHRPCLFHTSCNQLDQTINGDFNILDTPTWDSRRVFGAFRISGVVNMSPGMSVLILFSTRESWVTLQAGLQNVTQGHWLIIPPTIYPRAWHASHDIARSARPRAVIPRTSQIAPRTRNLLETFQMAV